MKWLEANDDSLCRFMLREPRGYPPLCCNLIVPPKHPDAVAGFIIMEQVEYPMMSGGNTIVVATVLLETGMVPMQEPVTKFNLEAPAGLIGITAQCRDGKVLDVTFENVPAFCAPRGAAGGSGIGPGERRCGVGRDVLRHRRYRPIGEQRARPGVVAAPGPGHHAGRGPHPRGCSGADRVSHPDYPGVGITIVQLSGADVGT